MSCIKHHFDEDAADKACRFIEMLPHIKGRMAGSALRLADWQRDRVVRPLFGWKREDGTRTYRTAYIEVPRKNGKSTLCAGIALCLLFCDGEAGAEVYSAAGTRDQALMVFDPACAMIRETDLHKHCQIYKSQKRVVYKNSFYRAVAADAGTIHGTNPHGVIFDELHVQPNRDLWDTFATGRGERLEPLTVAITTAGYDRSSICWELHEYARRVADPNDPLEDETFLSVIYGAEPEEDWTDPEVWAKANPNLGISIFPAFLQEECQKAKDSPAYENTFRRLYLNQWTEQSIRWISLLDWDKGADPERDVSGCRCWAGLDLASTRDVTALVLCFELDDDIFYWKAWLWAPEKPKDTRAQQDRTQVKNWQSQGLIGKHPGETIEYTLLADQVLKILQEHNCESLAVDPAGNAEAVIQMLCERGWPLESVEKFAQNPMNYSPAMNDTERRLSSGKLFHDGNPAMRWMAGNVAPKTDHNGNIKPDKQASGDKIDGMVAGLMAHALAIHDLNLTYEFEPGTLAL